MDTEERHAKLLEAEKQFLDSKQALNEMYAQRERELNSQMLNDSLRDQTVIYGSLTQMLRDSGAERTGIYKAMFLTEKAFATASAAVQIPDAMSKALNMPWPANMAAMASVAALGATIVSNIASVSAGFSEGGYTGHGGKYDPAGIVHKGEVVFSQADIARLGGVGVVEAMRKGQKGYSDGGVVGSPKMIKMGEVKQQAPVINIHNAPPGTTATQNSDGSIDIDLVERQIANRLSNANSVISKSLKQNTTASRRR